MLWSVWKIILKTILKDKRIGGGCANRASQPPFYFILSFTNKYITIGKNNPNFQDL